MRDKYDFGIIGSGVIVPNCLKSYEKTSRNFV